MLKIGLLGLGVVGAGVYEIINLKKGESLASEGLEIKKILIRDLGKDRGYSIPKHMLTTDFSDILNDPEIGLIACVMGGQQFEYECIKQALMLKKHVVTANKEVLARHIDELTSLAKENGVQLLFEASVGGGIPIINSVVELLKINRIDRITGILNGTTNYILTKIAKEKMQFNDVLKEAQQLGFAEADPSADIEGFDVMRKISILASLCFQTVIKEEDVHQRGISNVRLDDLLMADYFGYAIKYIAKAARAGNSYSVTVAPVLIRKDSVIANVNAEYNIVIVDGDIIGELCFIGKGAGRDATANAVVSDILKITNESASYSHISFSSDASSIGIEGLVNEYYVRICIDSYECFSEVLDCLASSVKKDRLIYQNGMVFLTTEKILSTEMQLMCSKLKEYSEDVFYARLDDSLM
ncbi:MAG: homoserine dehydrogenase [Eubacteriaceae bacterium]|nr:homoserine dehydrogenase [Eubacteriaceae bacterium]